MVSPGLPSSSQLNSPNRSQASAQDSFLNEDQRVHVPPSSGYGRSSPAGGLQETWQDLKRRISNFDATEERAQAEKWIKAHPWPSLCGSFVLGALVGKRLFRP